MQRPGECLVGWGRRKKLFSPQRLPKTSLQGLIHSRTWGNVYICLIFSHSLGYWHDRYMF